MKIIHYPHPALRWKSQPIEEINASLRRIVAEMFELMYEARGIGLAANQVGLPLRLFILNLGGEQHQKDEELVFINPEILHRRGTLEEEEGCLSLPGLYAPVKRSAEVVVEAFDLQGRRFEYVMKQLGSRAVQHETDHLDGILFIDHLSESAKMQHAASLAEFEKKYLDLQRQGLIPPDDEIRQQLRTFRLA